MVIKSYHIILAVKILGWFLLKWAGFGELLGWKSSTRSGNTAPNNPNNSGIPLVERNDKKHPLCKTTILPSPLDY